MRCPFCGADDTQVKDSRPTDDRGAIRRRRFCANCAARFTTFERVQLRELTVMKKNNQREPFDRDKLARSIYVALRKRPVEPERVERIINSLVRQLESSGETEIPSDMIGELVMEALSTLDQVAYIRFASVYRNFREANDFGEFVRRIAAGIARIVVALEDPDPRVAGGGVLRLRGKGLAVETGLCADAAAEVNAGFLHRLKLGRPLVTLKLATSLDGRIATSAGESRWI